MLAAPGNSVAIPFETESYVLEKDPRATRQIPEADAEASQLFLHDWREIGGNQQGGVGRPGDGGGDGDEIARLDSPTGKNQTSNALLGLVAN